MYWDRKKVEREIKIAVMQPAHLSSVLSIERKIQPEPWSKEMFLGELRKNLSINFVALLDGAVVGYISSTIICDELHILNIGVAPAHQRKRIGHILLTRTEMEARKRKVRKILLEVRESNLAAMSLYEKAGFFKVGVRPNYYTSGSKKEAAVLMTKHL